MISFDADQLRPWLEQRIGLKTHPETAFIGCEIGGKVKAVLAFSHYIPDTDVDVSLASEANGGAKVLIWPFLNYVFGQLNCKRCTARIPVDNAKSIKLATRLGFEMEGRLRHGFGDRDALVFGLLRENIHGLRRQPPVST
jgi:hypothetical protein